MSVDPKGRKYWFKSYNGVALTAGTPVELHVPASGTAARIMGWSFVLNAQAVGYFHKTGGAFMTIGLITNSSLQQQPPDFPGVTVATAAGSGNGIDITINFLVGSDATIYGYFWGYDE